MGPVRQRPLVHTNALPASMSAVNTQAELVVTEAEPTLVGCPCVGESGTRMASSDPFPSTESSVQSTVKVSSKQLIRVGM